MSIITPEREREWEWDYGALRRHLVPGTTTSILTRTSKMPGPSFSLPAHTTCPGANMAAGSVCSSCYASKGQYGVVRVQRAQQARMRWTVGSSSIVGAGFSTSWIEYMSIAILATGCEYFRIHDSGDFFSPVYVRMWGQVVIRCPHVKFWAPTRSYKLPKIADALLALAALPNITVRPSSDFVDHQVPAVDGLASGSGVHSIHAMAGSYWAGAGEEGVKICPAHTQGNQCAACRACWDEPDTAISYALH